MKIREIGNYDINDLSGAGQIFYHKKGFIYFISKHSQNVFLNYSQNSFWEQFLYFTDSQRKIEKLMLSAIKNQAYLHYERKKRLYFFVSVIQNRDIK